MQSTSLELHIYGNFFFSPQQVNFVISQVLALACAPLFRNTLHPATTRPATRHAFGLVLGLVFGYFCFGM
jgi:hypothetical protein